MLKILKGFYIETYKKVHSFLHYHNCSHWIGEFVEQVILAIVAVHHDQQKNFLLYHLSDIHMPGHCQCCQSMQP